jgi:Phage integrase, N-terminal SAM-like domain
MKGHIRKRGNSWAIVLEIRDPVTGARKRKWRSFSNSDGILPPKKAAEVECRRLLTELGGGGYIDPTKETVLAFLDRWLEHMQGQVSPRSHERYVEIARKNLAPLLGALSLTKPPVATGRAGEATCTASYATRYSKPCSGRCSRATRLTS